MELNREHIIKALECCVNPEECCEDCILLEDRNCGVNLLKNALSLIKELIEENERLRNRVVCKVVIPDEKLEEIKNECLEKVELDIKAIQADTVREMQERVLKVTKPLNAVGVGFLETVLEDIAEEMLGETK